MASAATSSPLITAKKTAPLAASTSPSGGPSNAGAGSAGKELEPSDVGSPHELINWVDGVLAKLESRFDGMSDEVLSRLETLGSRIDNLERGIVDLMEGNGGKTPEPTTPALSTSQLSHAAPDTTSTSA